MDKLSQLKAAIDEILDDDRVTHLDSDDPAVEFYQVLTDNGARILVKRNDRGDWSAYFDSGLHMPGAPSHTRPNEVVAWALQ
jgi:hypothetical protein